MKRTTLAIALLGATTMAAPAANTMWQGDLFVTAVNNAMACDAVKQQVGDFARANFRPKSVAGNGASDLLSMVYQRAAVQMSPTGGSLDAGTVATVRTIFGSAGFSQVTNSAFEATVSPAAPTTATKTVSITITINNYFSSSGAALSGCNVTMSGALSKRPN